MEGQAEMVKQIDTIFLAIFQSHRIWCIKIFVWSVQYVITSVDEFVSPNYLQHGYVG
jgi:hypothetical protein